MTTYEANTVRHMREDKEEKRKQATERLRRLANANCKDMEELKKLLSETT